MAARLLSLAWLLALAALLLLGGAGYLAFNDGRKALDTAQQGAGALQMLLVGTLLFGLWVQRYYRVAARVLLACALIGLGLLMVSRGGL